MTAERAAGGRVGMEPFKFIREFAMPNSATFKLPPVASLLKRHINGANIIVDPFARNSDWGTLTNDIDPSATSGKHMDAVEFCDSLIVEGIKAEVVLLDP